MNLRFVKIENVLVLVCAGPKNREKLISWESIIKILNVVFSDLPDQDKILKILQVEGGFRVEELAALISRKKSFVYQLLADIPAVSVRDRAGFACYSLLGEVDHNDNREN